ncbi:ABC transporter substrate-binding protein [Gracilibacillus suaedae]|uniref:ABC transporter substrate-binding protein n=1 Tax=Gracilibacillus suaedae TaxID=2820273 RepID=UPI001ABDAA3A|nr:ABC transporter substrate-binding protein [Gracilibacillus suaedae]
MKKTIMFIFISLLVSGCHSDSTSDELEEIQPKITLTIRNPKIEIASAFEEMTQAYEKEYPHVNIEVTTVGGALDDFSDLKAQLAAEEGPDIFTNPGYQNTKLWEPYLENLSDQPWIENAYQETLAPVKLDGHVYGMPMNLEGFGIIYNKDLFQKAGIKKLPSTFTELKTITKQLEKAGITPFATGYYEKWILGDHLMNIAISQQEDPDQFIRNLKNGTTSIENNRQFKQLIELLDLTIEYGGENPLSTDYTMEVQQFTSAKAAMMIQGNWIQPMINKKAPNIKIGIFPITINDQAAKNTFNIHVPGYWVVNKQTSAEKKDEAKRFLNWMVNSEQGQSFMTEKLHFIPAFSHVDMQETDSITSKITHLYQANRRLSSNWSNLPPGLKEQFGADTQQYIEHKWSKAQLLQAYQKTWRKMN